jgi:hypothetical protein
LIIQIIIARAKPFITKVAFAAEKSGHRLNWRNVYNKAESMLFAYESKEGITENELTLKNR